MVGRLLLRGMLVGVVAGLLCFVFLKVVGEPQVDRAIAFEAKMDAAKEQAAAGKGQAAPAATPDAMPDAMPAEELVSRSTQAGLGLLTGVGVYNVAFGGLFALAFAIAHMRMGGASPRASAALLAGMGFAALYLVPSLKYPANPPSVGDPETIGMRTGLYFSMIVVSLVAMVAASKLRLILLDRLGAWNAALTAGLFYCAAMLVVGLLFPGIDEVPDGFPAAVLWRFRLASLGAQAIMWGSIGLLFGALAERLMGTGGPAEVTRLEGERMPPGAEGVAPRPR